VVWRDIMVEGPAVDDGAARAAWLAPRLGMTRKTYAGGWREGRETLARAATDDEVVLWFEQDLFCAVNLWFVLGAWRSCRPAATYSGTGWTASQPGCSIDGWAACTSGPARGSGAGTAREFSESERRPYRVRHARRRILVGRQRRSDGRRPQQRGGRKVRAPQGRVLANGQGG